MNQIKVLERRNVR